MEGFLEEIAGLDGASGQSVIYNSEFFSKHIDLDTLIGLLQVSHTYSSIIDLLNKRHDKVDTATLQKLSEELKTLGEKVNSIKGTQAELCNNKLDNDNVRKAMYQASEIDFDKIRELATLDSRIDSLLAENVTKLEVALVEEKSKKSENEKVVGKREKLDVEIESYIGRLNELFAELNGVNINMFNGLDIDTLKEQYEQGLTNTIQNTSARKAYVSYVFDILKREIKMIPEICATAQQFVASAKKENGFDVPELIGKNDQIMLNESITSVAHDGLRQFADIWCRNATDNDKAITTIGNGYLSTQPFIDGMYDYIANLSTYNQDHSKGGADYDKLFSFNNQLHGKIAEIQTKDSRMLINVVNRVRNEISTRTNSFKRYGTYQSVEREPYEFATRIFDSFNHRHGDMRTQTFDNKQTTIPNEQQTEQINPISPVTGISVPQQLTEEQKAMLINNAIGTAINTPSDETLNSGGMKR